MTPLRSGCGETELSSKRCGTTLTVSVLSQRRVLEPLLSTSVQLFVVKVCSSGKKDREDSGALWWLLTWTWDRGQVTEVARECSYSVMFCWVRRALNTLLSRDG